MKLFISEKAESDVLREVQRYRELGLSGVAERFYAAFFTAADAVLATPLAGSPRPVRNPKLAGLGTWRLRGFEAFRVYYLTEPDAVAIVRVLHGSRDVARILEERG